jgi:hypothetical protein
MINETHPKKVYCGRRLTAATLIMTAMLLVVTNAPVNAETTPINPGVEAGRLSITGLGAAPNALVGLSIAPRVSLTAKANKDGAFSFPPIPYDFVSSLGLSFNIPVYDSKKSQLKNDLLLQINPGAFNVNAEGTATKAASIALNVGGEAAATAVANNSAFFRVSSPAKFSSMKADDIKIVASIINVTESCCPRVFAPTEPVTIFVQNIKPVPAPTPRLTSTSAGSPPVVQPAAKIPAKETAPLLNAPKVPPKPGTPVSPRARPAENDDKSGDLLRGSLIQTGQIETETVAFASVDSTWVNGMRQVSTQLVQTMMIQTRMIGGFIDTQAALDSQRALQRLQAQALKDYTPGVALCQFGTLSRSLAASESRGVATQKIINEVMLDRELMRKSTFGSVSAGDGNLFRMHQFKNDFCGRTDESSALDQFCVNPVTATNINRDIDYTRALDIPLTLDINFLGTATPEQQRNNVNLLALAENLYSNEKIAGFEYNAFERGGVVADDAQSMRTIMASRGIARNSFAALVGMKAQGTAASGQYMRAVLTQMGLPAADAQRLVGENPSYFAQMEVLTKRLYQDPRFFAELYDKPANVDRQRAAMRGINLAQQNDLLDVLQRREMLLSILLELKLQNLDEKDSGN